MMYNLETMTDQEVFNAVCNHLLTQHKRSAINGDENRCRYRGPDGLKCAAGIFIDDDRYMVTMEGKTWDTLVELGRVPSEHSMLITRLQQVHDQIDPTEWKTSLGIFAHTNNLEIYNGI